MLPKFGEAYPFLENAAKCAERLDKKIIIEKGPLCFCPDMPNVSYIFEKILIDTKRFIKPESCSACPSNEKCHGVHRNYSELYPLTDLKNKDVSKLRIISRC